MSYILFEQPLNEFIRLCLRLEQLFQQAEADISNSGSVYTNRNAVNTIIRLLNVTDRPDLKGKLTKNLAQYITQFELLQDNPEVDSNKLSLFLDKLSTILDNFHNNRDKSYHNLREHALLKPISQYFSNPGGPADFNTPEYKVWLNQDNTKIQQDLNSWLNEFSILQQAVNLILNLTRSSQNMSNKRAENGFFQLNLDSPPVTQLIRVKISTANKIWPEISVGRHRLAIYFITDNEKDKEAAQNLEFKLACCH